MATECGDRHWAYEECPCLASEWPEAHEYEGVDDQDVAWMDEVLESPPPSPKKKAKPLQQPPERPPSMKILKQVGPQQVKLMTLSEVEQLEEYYDGDQARMPRNLAMAISFRKQTLDGDPAETQEVKKRRKPIGRFVKHAHHTHTTHTAHGNTTQAPTRSLRWHGAEWMASSSTMHSSCTL